MLFFTKEVQRVQEENEGQAVKYSDISIWNDKLLKQVDLDSFLTTKCKW